MPLSTVVVPILNLIKPLSTSVLSGTLGGGPLLIFWNQLVPSVLSGNLGGGPPLNIPGPVSISVLNVTIFYWFFPYLSQRLTQK